MICNNLHVEKDGEGNVNLVGQSQDEQLVANIANQSLYFSLVFRNKKAIGLKDNQDGSIIGYKILRTIDFSPSRKLMTVVVESRDKKIYAFTKGADAAVLPLLNRGDLESESVQGILRSVENFTHQSLRVIIYAFKEIRHLDADSVKTAPVSSLETNLKLIGSTGSQETL